MQPKTLKLIALAVAGIAVGLAAVFALLIHRLGPPHVPAELLASRRSSAGAGELSQLWQVPDFSFPDQAEKQVTPRSLAGRVWIADFIFTTCTTVCPLITAKMVKLQRKLPDPELRFVSFSVDPAHDTPKALEAYRRTWNAGESRWILLSTDPKGLRATVQGMHVALQATDDPANPIIHTSLLFLVDGAGAVRGIYDSSDDEALGRLVADTKRLLGKAGSDVARPRARSGRELFESLSCAACHNDVRLAPPLAGLVGRSVALQDGRKTRADAAYIKESIVAPGRALVRGYLNLMPSYRDDLDDTQLERLVTYVAGLGSATAPDPGSDTPASIVTDPVCGMSVRATTSAPYFDFQGQTYYFCCESCRERFAKDPGKFLSSKGGPAP
jgi:protein SCO1/2